MDSFISRSETPLSKRFLLLSRLFGKRRTGKPTKSGKLSPIADFGLRNADLRRQAQRFSIRIPQFYLTSSGKTFPAW
jgi:hypothetical protein